MSFLSPARAPISLRVTNRQLGGTTLGQVAHFRCLLHTESEAGECEASILLNLTLHALDENDQLGPALTGPGFAPRPELLEAKNNTLVDAATGEVLAVRSQILDEAWQAHIELLSEERDTLLQGDFFQKLRDAGMPGTIRQMIEHHIQQADALGRFA